MSGFEVNAPAGIVNMSQVARQMLDENDVGGAMEFLVLIEQTAKDLVDWLRCQNTDGVQPSITWTEFSSLNKIKTGPWAP